MNKHLRKVVYFGLAALMIGGVGASASADQSANASINPDNYGIDVFPNKQTHNQFAYQLRNRGHNGQIYYANLHSKLGKAIFGEGVPNNDYANYMARHHSKLFKSITKKLERRVNNKHRTKVQKRVRKVNNRRHRVTKRNKRVRRYNRKVRKTFNKNKNKKSNHRKGVLKARFKRSNNKRALKRSGFYDAKAIGGNFIFDKYAPNDKRAVVSKRANVDHWYKGRFGQAHPIGYVYVPQLRGWVQFK